MKRQQILDRINEIAREYVHCDGIYGINGWKKDRLAVMLADYEEMIVHERKYRKAIKDSGLSNTQLCGLGLMAAPPAWYAEACAEGAAAMDIWRKGH